MPLKKAHEVAVAKSAKRQNTPGATSRKQLTLKHLPILLLNGSVEGFNTIDRFATSRLSAEKPAFRVAEMYCTWRRDGDRFSQQS
jgi:hypothetical protein